MFKLLRTLFEIRHKEVTLILWEDENADQPQSFRFFPVALFLLLSTILVLAILVVNIALYVTPAGNLIYNRSESLVRQQIMDVSNRVLALQDSLNVRDQQLGNMRDVIRMGADTTFVPILQPELFMETDRSGVPVSPATFRAADYDFLRNSDVALTNPGRGGPLFPVNLPVNGILSSEFNPEVGHFGIDIAASVGTPFRALADGVIVSVDWTMNYGYIIYIQHDEGYLSVYKHSAPTQRKTGDNIRKGDILGTVSVSGIISSGPHLHYELWRNSRPLNPLNFMIY
jgi:murein DD-endopeptidase MepM/ murein hydrolase activator NlpD